MKKLGMLILALALIYVILSTSVADINHGQGLAKLVHQESRL